MFSKSVLFDDCFTGAREYLIGINAHCMCRLKGYTGAQLSEHILHDYIDSFKNQVSTYYCHVNVLHLLYNNVIICYI